MPVIKTLKKSDCNFSFKHYDLILKLLKKNYKFSSFLTKPEAKLNRVYMRHDIDIALDKAVRLAEIEHQNKIIASYFLQIDSPFYNLFERENIQRIKQIIKFGHQLGLHLDEKFCRFSKRKIAKEAKIQLKILKQFFPIKSIVSIHRPSQKILNQTLDPKLICVYQPEFFKKNKYISDSMGNWREGCPCKILTSKKLPQHFQILTHPIWWGRNSENVTRLLRGYLKKNIKNLDDYLVKNIKSYHSSFEKFDFENKNYETKI